ncbi:hypothetical protein [Ferrimicrobium sp.]|uniref:hypothetical protein n=1 Tax=Ferrimicrobium sp. TaxID=2926050 RepID=UPI00260AABE9|nr:hypothetical protein [Ferrimicrobium sp.]
MKVRRSLRLLTVVLIGALVLASCTSPAKGSVSSVISNGTSTLRIPKSSLTKRFLIIKGSCTTTAHTPGLPVLKMRLSLTHQSEAVTAAFCHEPRSTFAYYLDSSRFPPDATIQLFSFPPQIKWTIAFSRSTTRQGAKSFSIFSTYVPPAPKPPVLPARAPTCTPSQISVRITGVGDEASVVNAYLAVSDLSSSPCSLDGWPTIYGVTASGESIPLVRQSAMGQNGHILHHPSFIVIKRDVQAAYSQVTFMPDCIGGNTGVIIEKNFTSLSVTLPNNLGKYSIASSAFNQGSAIQTPDSCYYASGKLYYGTIYAFFVPSFGEPAHAL